MKITFISTLEAYWGGSEELWTRTALKAKQEGHNIQIVLYKQKSRYHPTLHRLINISDSSIFIIQVNPRSSILKKGLQLIQKKINSNPLESINTFRPDLILINQVHNYSAAFNPFIQPFLLNTKFPYILLSQFNHDYLTLNNHDREKAILCYKNAAKSIFVSHRNLERTQHQLAFKLKNTKTIDNPLNLKNIQLIPWPESQSINFASVARLECNFKGQDNLIKILSSPKWLDRPWHLNFYGSGPDETYLYELIDYYGLKDRISIKGHVDDIRKVWAHNHILLMASIAEGKPLALEEAMVCGRPAVVSDVAGNSELVEDNITSFMATSFFTIPFEEALDRAWQNQHRWKEMGLAAYEKMTRELDFSPETTLLNIITQQK